MKIFIDERPVSDDDQWTKFQELARRYTEVGNRADNIVRELRNFKYGKSLSAAVDKIRENEELIAQIKARIDLLWGETGMRLTE
ncbi:MAG: hypothetical protein IPJ71_19390 [Bdellovibrionales bacterium]|nr:hypothetical protein [Bdellovibrionales bacterium]